MGFSKGVDSRSLIWECISVSSLSGPKYSFGATAKKKLGMHNVSIRNVSIPAIVLLPLPTSHTYVRARSLSARYPFSWPPAPPFTFNFVSYCNLMSALFSFLKCSLGTRVTPRARRCQLFECLPVITDLYSSDYEY